MRSATDSLRAEGYRFETVAVLDGFVAVVVRDDDRWLGWGAAVDARSGMRSPGCPSGRTRRPR